MLSRPTYGQGFARNTAQSAFPELWRGLAGLWSPSLGPTGLILRDWSGNQNDGVLTGMDAAADWIVGQKRYALDYEGTNNHIAIQAQTLLSNWSITAWIFGADENSVSAANSMILGDRSTDLDWIYTADNLRTRFLNSAGISATWTSDTDFYHVWRFFALIADTTGVTLYLDGISQGRLVITPSFVFSNIGAGHTLESLNFEGQIGDISLYNRELTQQEISVMFAGASPLVRKKDIPLGISGFNIQNFLSLMQGDRL